MQKTVSLRHEFVCLLIFITILRAHPLYELQVPPAITKYSPSGTTRLLPSLHVFVSSIQQVVLKLSTIIYAAKKRPYKRGVVITYISANHLTSRDTSRRQRCCSQSNQQIDLLVTNCTDSKARPENLHPHTAVLHTKYKVSINWLLTAYFQKTFIKINRLNLDDRLYYY